jgi:hypothetical protein
MRMPRVAGSLVAVVVMLVLSLVPTGHATGSSGRPSANVLVIPAFQAPHYPGAVGVPRFPTSDPRLAAYHFAQLGAGAVTPAALQPYDTIVLYGVRWATLSASDQAAINAFALTGKVVIWDADATGSQNYASFIHPFSTTSSGEVERNSSGGVVSFPSGANPLASSNPSSPLYLDPSALTASTDLIEDMSVMHPGQADWTPALVAANDLVPKGGWVLAWGYGSSADQTGMVIYSGLDADVFGNGETPNYALKELAIELAAPFEQSPGNSPPPSGGGSGGGGGSGLGSPGSPTFASCSFARRPPVSWVHGRVALYLTTSVAAGIHGNLVTAGGRVVGSGVVTSPGHLKLVVDTRKLPSNHEARLTAVVYVNAARACAVSTRLKIDNSKPRLLALQMRGSELATLLSLKVSEAVLVSVRRGARTIRAFHLLPGRTVTVYVPGPLRGALLVLSDRAGNRTVRMLR